MTPAQTLTEQRPIQALTSLADPIDDCFERLLEEAVSPYELGMRAAMVALEHIRKVRPTVQFSSPEIFRKNIGDWVEWCIGYGTFNHVDLGYATIRVVKGQVFVDLVTPCEK